MQQPKKLNQRMKAAVEYIINENPMARPADIAKHFGLHLNTVCNWFYSDVFISYYDQRLKEEWSASGRKAQRMMNQLMESGDYKATEYILKCNGIAPEEKIEQNINISYTIDYGEDESRAE